MFAFYDRSKSTDVESYSPIVTEQMRPNSLI